jgi:hypothetical protein
VSLQAAGNNFQGYYRQAIILLQKDNHYCACNVTAGRQSLPMLKQAGNHYQLLLQEDNHS